MCVYVMSMYEVQISPQVFGTVICVSCSQPTDPWLKYGVLEEELNVIGHWNKEH